MSLEGVFWDLRAEYGFPGSAIRVNRLRDTAIGKCPIPEKLPRFFGSPWQGKRCSDNVNTLLKDGF